MIDNALFVAMAISIFMVGFKTSEFLHYRKSTRLGKLKKSPIRVYPKQYYGYFYIYNSENDRFIVRVKTMEELVKYLNLEYADRIVTMLEDHVKLFGDTNE